MSKTRPQSLEMNPADSNTSSRDSTAKIFEVIGACSQIVAFCAETSPQYQVLKAQEAARARQNQEGNAGLNYVGDQATDQLLGDVREEDDYQHNTDNMCRIL